MASLRSKEMKEKYQAYRAAGGLDGSCVLCEAPALQTFVHWKVADNKFPYDLIASTHHMLIPLLHQTDAEISAEAWSEFRELKKNAIGSAYDFIIEGTLKKISIPGHFHLHLVVIKEE